jgi:hypothetical protein
MRQLKLDSFEIKLAIEQLRSQNMQNSQNIELVFQYLDELLETSVLPLDRAPIGFKIENPETE